MKILVACEFSGVVRDAFAAKGHYAVSCDLLPSESPRNHFQGDIFDFILNYESDWDMMIAHPPCTYLSGSGMHWTTRGLRDPQLTEDALKFVSNLMLLPFPRICIENPVGVISTRITKPTQIIQPYEFGHDASKRTCLWLKGLPKLVPTNYIEPRIVNGKKRWGNQTDSGQNRLGPSEDRWAKRSVTYQGIAEAMAEQWG
jgi:hypothetical protein